MENNDKQNQGSGFWWGLIIGAVAAGLVVLLLDKEEKDNLKENIKNDWEKILEKIKELVGEKRNGIKTPEDKLERQVKKALKLVSEPKDSSTEKVVKGPSKKFFKKSGKILH